MWKKYARFWKLLKMWTWMYPRATRFQISKYTAVAAATNDRNGPGVYSGIAGQRSLWGSGSP